MGVQYLAAIRALKREGVVALKRTIHVMFVPGMCENVKES